MMNDLMDTFEISPVNREILRAALQLETRDFEDAVQIASAQADELDFIITRDVEDYKNSPVKILAPMEFMAQIG